jgi:hypothetical protein
MLQYQRQGKADVAVQVAHQVLRRNPARVGDGPSQSRLAYHRAIRPGESIAYEFFHEPDAVMVHPALGRLAFRIEATGVRLHRLTDGASERTGLAPDNALEEPTHRRGPPSCPSSPAPGIG